MAQLTNTEAFANRLAAFDDDIPSEKIRVTIREAEVSAGTTFVVKLPASLGFLSEPHLQFDLEMDFDYVEDPIPSGFATTKALVYNNVGAPVSAGTQTALNNFKAVVARQLGIAVPGQSAALANFLNNASYNVPNFACDAPPGLGWTTLFQNIQLNQDTTGYRIDETNQAEGYEDFIDMKMMTKVDKDSYIYDASMGTNVWGSFPGIQANLSSPLNVSGSRRANRVRLNGQTLTVTKSVNMPIPLWIGDQWLLNEFGDCNLLFQMNANPSFCVAPRWYSGYMTLEKDGQLPYQAKTTSSLIQTVTYSPVCNLGDLGDHPTGEYSMITLGLQGITLDTADLTEILGDPQLEVPVITPPVANGNPLTGTKLDRPLATIYRSGITLFMRVAAIDAPFTPLLNGPLPAAQMADGAFVQSADRITGIPVLRDSWVRLHVPGSNIAQVYLTNSFTEPQLQLTSASQLQDKNVSCDLTEAALGQKGKVTILFGAGAHVSLPIHQADYSGKQTMAINAGNTPVNMAHPRCVAVMTTNTVDDTVICTAVSNNNSALVSGVSPRANWAPVFENVGIEIRAITGAPSQFSMGSSTILAAAPGSTAPMIGCTTTPTAYNYDPYGTANENVLIPTPSNVYQPQISPKGWRLKNVVLAANRVLLPLQVQKSLDELISSETGLIIERPVAVTVRSQVNSFDSNTFTFQSIVQQPYGMKFGLRIPTVVPGYPGAGAFVPFSYFTLNQGSFNVVNYDKGTLRANHGGKWPTIQPVVTATGVSYYAPVTMFKGTGSNEYFMSKIRTCYANMYGENEAGSVKPFINGAYAMKNRRMLDVVYPMNTLGGSAQILPQTNWQCRFGVDTQMFPSVVQPRQFYNSGGPRELPVYPVAAQTVTWYNAIPAAGYGGFEPSTPDPTYDILSGPTPGVQLVNTTYCKKQWVIKKDMAISTSKTTPTWFMTM